MSNKQIQLEKLFDETQPPVKVSQHIQLERMFDDDIVFNAETNRFVRVKADEA